MVRSETPFCLTDAHNRLFCALSHDRNPLHSDPDYARRTPFGQTISYGMAAVLLALARSATGRRIHIHSIRGQFLRPIFPGLDYRLEIAGDDLQTTLRVTKGSTTHLDARIHWHALDLPRSHAREAPRFMPRGEASATSPSEAPLTIPEFAYAPAPEAFPELQALFHLAPEQIPCEQLAALCWASYFVGMEQPGRQALFSEFEFEFTPEPSAIPHLLMEIDARYDPRFRRLLLTGRGTTIRRFSLVAFHRPEPMDYSDEALRAEFGMDRNLSGQRTLVTGTARGFGSVVARALALRGAAVLQHRRRSGDHNTSVVGELSRDEDCQRIAAQVATEVGQLDLLIHNAFPHVNAQKFLDQSPAEFLGYVQRAIDPTARLTHHLLPLMAPGSTVVLVSSHYVCQPPPQFTHYITTKAALEGMVHSLAAEFPAVRFVIARLPRMLTDQTQAIYELRPPISPTTIAQRLLSGLATLPSGNFHELNLFLPTD